MVAEAALPALLALTSRDCARRTRRWSTTGALASGGGRRRIAVPRPRLLDHPVAKRRGGRRQRAQARARPREVDAGPRHVAARVDDREHAARELALGQHSGASATPWPSTAASSASIVWLKKRPRATSTSAGPRPWRSSPASSRTTLRAAGARATSRSCRCGARILLRQRRDSPPARTRAERAAPFPPRDTRRGLREWRGRTDRARDRRAPGSRRCAPRSPARAR